MFSLKFKVPVFENTIDYVAGFSRAYGVQFTSEISYAKKFKTKRAAEKFIEKYSGAGYGLTKDMVEIV